MAPKLLHCLLQVCFDDKPSHDEDGTSGPPQSNRIARFLPTALDEDEAEYGRLHEQPSTDGDCCDTATTATTAAASSSSSGINTTENTADTTNSRMSGIREFWRNVQEKLSLVPTTGDNNSTTPDATTTTTSSTTIIPEEHVPILTQASSFDLTSKESIPTIATEQVVLPGSALQQQMAKAMAAQLQAQCHRDDEDECVICMEGFDPTNPRMPTLCGCGENKTYFHLPCLYQWVQQSGRKCPSCRKKLRWEEF